MKKVWLFLAVGIAVGAFIAGGYASADSTDDQYGREIKAMKCIISRVDHIEHEIGVRGLEEITFKLEPGIRFYHGEHDAGAGDLKPGTHAVIKYYYDTHDTPRLLSLTNTEEE